MCDHFYGELWKITREGGGEPGMSERHFQLVLVAQPFTHSLPARIQWLT